jgi:hypothetical protein
MPRHGISLPARAAGADDLPDRLTDDQIGRLAAMVADGRCEFPKDLQAADRERLLRDLRRLLRERLVRHIARAVAHYLHRDAGHRLETPDHA